LRAVPRLGSTSSPKEALCLRFLPGWPHGEHITCQIRAHLSTPALLPLPAAVAQPAAVQWLSLGLGLGQQPATTGAHRWKAGAFALVASCGPYHPTPQQLWPAAAVQAAVVFAVLCYDCRLPAYTRLPDHTCREQVEAPAGGAACVHRLVRPLPTFLPHRLSEPVCGPCCHRCLRSAIRCRTRIVGRRWKRRLHAGCFALL
jgi:hypothetical protein